jgi:hypothetical protein
MAGRSRHTLQSSAVSSLVATERSDKSVAEQQSLTVVAVGQKISGPAGIVLNPATHAVRHGEKYGDRRWIPSRVAASLPTRQVRRRFVG